MGEKLDLNTGITRETAVGLLLKYNKEKFHIQHAVTVENVMKDYAEKLGYADEAAEWGIVGLLHDVDFEKYPEQHCIKAPELLREVNASDELIHAVCSHGYGITVDIKPEHEMERVLFACDELTGLIGAAALMRPSKSVSDMELKSLKKKFKDKKFAAGCSREIISKGAEMLGWELDKLLGDTLEIMRSAEKDIANDYKELTGEEL
jgi:predicted hydrolase (HD superfamily)